MDVPSCPFSGRAQRTIMCYNGGPILTRLVAATCTPPFRREQASSGLGCRTVPASAAVRPPSSPAADTSRRRRQLPRRRGAGHRAARDIPLSSAFGALGPTSAAGAESPSRHSRHIQAARRPTGSTSLSSTYQLSSDKSATLLVVSMPISAPNSNSNLST